MTNDDDVYYWTPISEIVEPLVRRGVAQLLPAADLRPFFDQLDDCFPFRGNKIAWWKMPGSIGEHCDLMQPSEVFAEFFKRMVVKNRLSGDVIIAKDWFDDIIIRGDIKALSEVMERIFHHHGHYYVTDPEMNWCMVFTFEGNMDFGYAPPRGSFDNEAERQKQ